MTTDADIIEKLRRAVKQTRSLRAWAGANGFSATYISFVLANKSRVTERLAAALGFKLVKTWERKGNHGN
jgi:lambda repressor-like predicted transcriptional regulator